MSEHCFFCSCLALLAVFGSTATSDSRAAVQIVGLRDSNAGTTLAAVPDNAAQAPTDSFCVISTTGSVKLIFINSGGVDAGSRSWRAHNTSGESIRYRQYAALAGDAIATLVSDPASPAIVVPIARAAKSQEGCGAGNISKGIVPVDRIPLRSSFSDNVTISVTPL